MSTKGQPPWHLWGNTQTVTIPGFTIPGAATSDTRPPSTAGQLCRVPYKRPETFHFLFASQLASGPTANADTTVIVTVDFDLTVGIGRSSIIMPAFEEHFWSWTNLPVPLDDQLRTTTVKGRRNVVEGTSVELTDIDEITAQDIQLQVRATVEVVIAAPNPPIVIPDINIIVSAQFAPKHHARPEWYEKIGRFPGGEDHAQ